MVACKSPNRQEQISTIGRLWGLLKTEAWPEPFSTLPCCWERSCLSSGKTWLGGSCLCFSSVAFVPYSWMHNWWAFIRHLSFEFIIDKGRHSRGNKILSSWDNLQRRGDFARTGYSAFINTTCPRVLFFTSAVLQERKHHQQQPLRTEGSSFSCTQLYVFLKGYFAACVLSESNASVSAWDKILWVLVAFFFSSH